MDIKRVAYLILLLFYLVGCKEVKTVSPAPVDVNAFIVEAQTIPADFEFVGVAKSSHPVEIMSRVEGYLESIDYTEGSLVNVNDPLFQIDPRQFEASVIMAEGALEREKAALWRATKSVERIAPLYKKNAASERDLDNAVGAMLAAQASVITAEGNLVKAKLDLSYTKITAPIKGLTGRSAYQPGTLITPNVNGLLTYISVLDPIWVLFSVTNNDLLKLNAEKQTEKVIIPETKDYTVYLTLSDGSSFPYKGKVNFLSPILDPKTGTMMVRAEFPNPDSQLLPGAFVKAKVVGAQRPNAIIVPQTAIFQGKGGMYVFVINSDNTLSRRKVQVGEWYKNYWVINDGLTVGEKIVAEGVNKVDEGTKVNVVAESCYVL